MPITKCAARRAHRPLRRGAAALLGIPLQPPEPLMSTEPDTPSAAPGPLPAVTPARVLAGLSLAVPVVALLWVSSYARLTPKLGGMPFFYWYQILWIPVSALFTGAAYLLLNHDAKQRKAANGGAKR
jgi:hypothetical protein